MQIKALTLGLIATTVLLSGCTGNKATIPPMPVDSNPSIALQYARAMNLRLITDYADGQYVIFNEDTGTFIRPLKEPVAVGQKGEVKSSGNGSADVLAGLITHTAFIPALSVLTSRSPAPYADGVLRIANWNGGDPTTNSLKVSAIMKKNLPLFTGFAESAYCQDGIGYSSQLNMNIDDTLPKPPLNVSVPVQVIAVTGCFNALAQKKENLEKVKSVSEELGDKWAVFVPGTKEGEPLVFNAGRSYRFVN